MPEKGSLLATLLFALTAAALAVAHDTPGVTATEIKIGNTFAYSGPASAYSVIAKPVSKNIVLYTVVRALVRVYGEVPDTRPEGMN